MAFMERITGRTSDGEGPIVRLLRSYAGRQDNEDFALSDMVAFGETLRLSPSASVALASVFELTEAVLGRPLVTKPGNADGLSADERAMLRLLGARMPTASATGTVDIPHGLPGALVWAVLSYRRLCGDLLPHHGEPTFPERTCPFGMTD